MFYMAAHTHTHTHTHTNAHTHWKEAVRQKHWKEMGEVYMKHSQIHLRRLQCANIRNLENIIKQYELDSVVGGMGLGRYTSLMSVC